MRDTLGGRKWLKIRRNPPAPISRWESPPLNCQMAASSLAMWERARAARVSWRRFSQSARSAPTIAARSPRGWLSTTPCAVPGITPASIFAPAKPCARRLLSPLDTWRVEQRDGKIFVREKRAGPKSRPRATPDEPNSIVIVGGGAAGFAAAEMLRRQKYEGGIVMLSTDDAPPVDRPNLSKDYLAGSAPEEWLPLRDPSFYSDNAIDLRLNTTVAAIDSRAREVALADGDSSLRPPASRDRRRAGPPVHPGRRAVGRARAAIACDCRAIIERAQTAKRAVVLARVSSASKSRPRYARAISRSMWLRRKSGRWREFWALTSAASCARFTSSTASSSICVNTASGSRASA